MTDEMNTGLDPNELMKRMKAIASDLWGGVSPAEEGNTTETPEPENAAGQEPEKKEPDIGSLWKTADETIDWTDALAHSAPA